MHSAVVAQLSALGLSAYEARAYVALLTREFFTASELAGSTGIPRQRVYDVVAGLTRRGLARQSPGAVTQYSATSPERAMSLLLASRRDDLLALEREAEMVGRELQETWASGRDQTSSMEYLDVVRDPALLGLRFEQMRDEAREQLLVWSKPPYVLTDNSAGIAATRRIVDGGGDVRSVYELSILDEPDLLADIHAYADAGEIPRFVHTLPMKVCLTDGSRGLFSLTDPVANSITATNIFVEHEALVFSLGLAFEVVWGQAMSLDEALAATS